MQASQKPFEVRRAHPPDAVAFAEFMRAAWREAGPDAPGFAGATDAVIDEITQTDAVVERMTGSGRTMHLAWHVDRVVGFSAMRRIDDDRIELAGIIVSRDCAGRGVGRSLVAASLEDAVSEGFSTCHRSDGMRQRCGTGLLRTTRLQQSGDHGRMGRGRAGGGCRTVASTAMTA